MCQKCETVVKKEFGAQRDDSGTAAGAQRGRSGTAAAGPPCGGQQGDSYNTLLEPSSETLFGNKNIIPARHPSSFTVYSIQ